MNQESFEKLLAYLDPDDRENAAKEYVLIEKKLITFFESRRCHLPEEHADITLTRAARIIDEGRAPDRAYRRGFFYTVAHYVLKECWDDKNRKNIPIEDLPPASQPFVDPEEERLHEEEQMESELRSRCLSECMEKLSNGPIKDGAVSHFPLFYSNLFSTVDGNERFDFVLARTKAPNPYLCGPANLGSRREPLK